MFSYGKNTIVAKINQYSFLAVGIMLVVPLFVSAGQDADSYQRFMSQPTALQGYQQQCQQTHFASPVCQAVLKAETRIASLSLQLETNQQAYGSMLIEHQIQSAEYQQQLNDAEKQLQHRLTQPQRMQTLQQIGRLKTQYKREQTEVTDRIAVIRMVEKI